MNTLQTKMKRNRQTKTVVSDIEEKLEIIRIHPKGKDRLKQLKKKRRQRQSN